jgi:hypothetical protein
MSTALAQTVHPLPRPEEQPHRDAALWCVYCPEFWTTAATRAQALWPVEEHERKAHPKAVSR